MKLSQHGAYIRSALFVLGLAAMVLLAIGSAAPATHVTLLVDGAKKEVVVTGTTVNEALVSNGLVVRDGDSVVPGVNTSVTEGMIVTVHRAVPVRVYINDGYLKVNTTSATVSDLLKKLGITLKSGSTVSPGLQTKITYDMSIVVDPKIELKELRSEILPFKTIKRTSWELAPGKSRVAQKGVNGTVTLFEQRLYHGSELISKSTVQKASVKAVDQIIEVGAGPADAKIGRAIRVEATAYVPGYDGVGWRTATGARAGRGIIAVDPRVIKLGTKLYVPGYGYGIAADTGGAIKGNRIDLCYDTIGPALQWGRRGATVYIVG